MKKYLDKDVTAGLFLIGLGATYYFMADSLPRSLLSDRVGAAGFPKLLAVTLIAFSAVLIVQSLLRSKASPARQEDEDQENAGKDSGDYHFKTAAGMLSLGIIYLIIVSRAGYMVSIALLLMAALRYQGEPFSRKMLLTGVLGGIFFWAFFVFALKTPMPIGIWPALLGGR